MKVNIDNNNLIIGYFVIHSETPYSATGYNYNEKTAIDVEIESVDKIHIGYSKVINGLFVENADAYNTHLEEEKVKEEKQAEINKLKQEMNEILIWLKANDYIINKHTLGEYSDTDEKWINYLHERQIKLSRYNELEAEVNK